jgi:hypothetical protein
MKQYGKIRNLHDEDDASTPNFWLQREGSQITVGIEHAALLVFSEDDVAIDLTPAEARKIAKWLLRDADKAERYTPDE